VIYRCRTPLEFLSDAAKLLYKLRRVADGEIVISYLLERRDELFRKIGSSELAESAFGIRVFFQVS
jgi:hypothetical protein